jgi:hypothetical protein
MPGMTGCDGKKRKVVTVFLGVLVKGACHED